MGNSKNNHYTFWTYVEKKISELLPSIEKIFNIQLEEKWTRESEAYVNKNAASEIDLYITRKSTITRGILEVDLMINLSSEKELDAAYLNEKFATLLQIFKSDIYRGFINYSAPVEKKLVIDEIMKYKP